MHMNTRCQPGDLAIIAYDVPGCEDNIGRVVAVRGPAAIDCTGHLTWLITPLTAEPYIVAIPATGGFRFMEPGEMLVDHSDDWMTPVDPDDLDEVLEVGRMKGVPA
jgi:hypothetical protein